MSRVGSIQNPNTNMGCDIPTRRIKINSVHSMPMDYSTTPGGTLFSTTPGGTRIIYDRAFLMQMRNSPMAKSPPTNLPIIPGVTAPGHVIGKENKPFAMVKTTTIPQQQIQQKQTPISTPTPTPTAQTTTTPDVKTTAGESTDEPQFQMDI